MTVVASPTPSTDFTPSRACRASQWTRSTVGPSIVWQPTTTTTRPRQTRGESSSDWDLSGLSALSTTSSQRLFQWRCWRWRTDPALTGWTCWRRRYSSRGEKVSPPVWPVNWSRWVRPRPTRIIPVLNVAGTGLTDPNSPLYCIFKLLETLIKVLMMFRCLMFTFIVQKEVLK